MSTRKRYQPRKAPTKEQFVSEASRLRLDQLRKMTPIKRRPYMPKPEHRTKEQIEADQKTILEIKRILKKLEGIGD